MLKSEQVKKRKNSVLSTALLFGLLLLGLGLMAYPTVSDWWNSFHQTRAIAAYEVMVNDTDQEALDALREEAVAYNARLPEKEGRFLPTEEELEEYNALLDPGGTGAMGYISIPRIEVNLPVYHGTSEAVLQIAVGHIEGSSLPVGGEGTHSVLSGHRGLPSARLFTDLDRLEEGDLFTLTVLNRVLTYEVDQIRIVLPGELDDLAIVPGEDYCTLVTCTPYGINTHRLLVRGRRVLLPEGKEPVVVTAGAIRIPVYIVIPAVGIPMLFLFLLGMLIYTRRHRLPRSQEDLEALYSEAREVLPPLLGMPSAREEVRVHEEKDR